MLMNLLCETDNRDERTLYVTALSGRASTFTVAGGRGCDDRIVSDWYGCGAEDSQSVVYCSCHRGHVLEKLGAVVVCLLLLALPDCCCFGLSCLYFLQERRVG